MFFTRIFFFYDFICKYRLQTQTYSCRTQRNRTHLLYLCSKFQRLRTVESTLRVSMPFKLIFHVEFYVFMCNHESTMPYLHSALKARNPFFYMSKIFASLFFLIAPLVTFNDCCFVTKCGKEVFNVVDRTSCFEKYVRLHIGNRRNAYKTL